ncbi:MAG TPA: 4Fe-4S dicluster domain-containing protein [Anaeromyxobacteraceae bacterium]|jgi:molybdopterin-containing oxidoreductase family iron-sulfur binding subunit
MPPLGKGALHVLGEGRGEAPADGRERWRSLAEREGGGAHPAEFPAGAAEAPEAFSRRGFFKILGASAALAGLGACRPPRDAIHPWVRQPEKAVVPGASLHYATALAVGGYGVGLLVTSTEGRPTKVEGNPDHPSSLGAAGAFEQAALLDLYDPRRLRGFTRRGQPLSHRAVLRSLVELAASHREDGGRRLRFLVGESASPLLADLRRRIQASYPGARFHVFESLARDEVRGGHRVAFGRPMEARLRLDRAAVILSLDDDFLALGPDRLRLARELAAGREPGPEMSRLYVAEAHLSLTGSSADHRLRMRPSEVLAFGRAVAHRLAEKHGLAALAGCGLAPAARAREAAAVADDLARARGRALVTAGQRQPAAVHALVAALNAALGAAGATVEYRPAPEDPAGAAPLRDLAAAIAAGQVDTLVVTASNPVYGAPADVDLGPLLARVPDGVYLTLRPDETSARSSFVVAASHPFESWGDLRATDGTASICQPLVAPLAESLSEPELLASFLGEGDRGGHALVKASWEARRPRPDFDAEWRRWLGRGLVPGTATAGEAPAVRLGAVAAAAGAVPAARQGLEASFVADAKVLDGRFAENAWMQELPDPVTKLTWDNAALLSPATARRLGVETGRRAELRLRGRRVEAPVYVVPGHADDVVTLPLGYGRTAAGPVGTNVGFSAGALRSGDAPWFEGGLALAPVGIRKHAFAATQEHFSMEGRDIALSFDRAQWSPEKVAHLRGALPTLLDPAGDPEEPYRWGMAIDLSRCTGCSACAVACQAENNVPVVGKAQVARSREMHWLRIDRYFAGDPENPEVLSQPVACVHCERAPCEYVCPVNATVHSDEGLNEMVYNRCVGTRYCSNNCPYKVRRFNFFEYNKEKPPTEKMLMNPDVTVRHRGVMEKCSYCVQRIERVRITARLEGRPIREGEVLTACQQACPAQAIVFGNLADPRSRVSAWHGSDRRYDLLHEVGTRPRTAYLVRIRNPNPELA